MWEHKNNFNPDSFACKYRCNQLVYYEHHSDIRAAIGREKQLKRWRREKKIMLIEKENRDWDDISKDWF
jgi:putative endonuclease